MFAAQNAPDLPLAYINHGGFADAARLIRSSRLDNVNALYEILQPNLKTWDNSYWRTDGDYSRIEAALQASLQRKTTEMVT